MTAKRKTNRKCYEPLSTEMLERAARTIKLLAHPHRLKIIEILENEADGAPVHQLTEALEIPQATVSQHLSAMQREGILQGSRHGKEVWYCIKDERALTILDCIRKRNK